MSAEKDFAVQLLQLQADLALDHGLNLADRSIQIVGDIDEDMFCEIDAKLALLEQQSRAKITLKINSEGGSVYDALAIVGRMERSHCKIITEGYGCIMSAAGLILAAGQRRKMHKLAFYMFHEGGMGLEGTLSQIEHQVLQSKREHKMWCEAMEQFSNRDSSFWENAGLSGHDLYLSSSECLQYAIIDEVF